MRRFGTQLNKVSTNCAGLINGSANGPFLTRSYHTSPKLAWKHLFSSASKESENDSTMRTIQAVNETNNLTEFSIASLEKLGAIRMLTFQLRNDARDKIRLSEYLDIATKQGIPEDIAMIILKQLHVTGQFFYFEKHDVFSNFVILKPSSIQAEAFDALSIDIGEKQLVAHRQTYDRIMNELRPLLDSKAKLDLKAEQSARMWVSGGMGALTCQGVVLAAGTWGEYGWDVIEPVTYFSGFTVVLGSFLYFIASRKDYDYGNVWEQLITNRRRAMYNKNNFDYLRFVTLSREAKELRAQIENVCVEVVGDIPESVDRAFAF